MSRILNKCASVIPVTNLTEIKEWGVSKVEGERLQLR